MLYGDNQFDRSGALLGRIRKLSRARCATGDRRSVKRLL